MKHIISIGLPILAVACLTAFSVYLVLWMIGLVPNGEWSGLVKAGIALFVAWCALLSVAWSAYFAYFVRKSFNPQ